MYVDDDTDVDNDCDPQILHDKIQQVANDSSSWLTDNRMCVAGEKSKLLVIGTRKLKSLKLSNPMEIQVSNMLVKETKSEKLLGIIINNELTWKEHLHGEGWREEGENAMGLIPQLSQRVGILRKLAKYVSGGRLKMFAEGMFYSKLNYCLPVFGHVFGLDKYRDTKTRNLSFTKGDNMVQKVIITNKPAYLARRLGVRNLEDGINTRNTGMLTVPRQKLSTTSGGFVARGVQLFNNLPLHLRLEKSVKKFKVGTRRWISENIEARPT